MKKKQRGSVISRLMKALAGLASLCLVLFLVGGIALYALLGTEDGDIPWVREQLETRLNELVGPEHSISIEKVGLDFSDRATISLTNVETKDRAGRTIVAAPQININPDISEILSKRKLVLDSASIRTPRVVLHADTLKALGLKGGSAKVVDVPRVKATEINALTPPSYSPLEIFSSYDVFLSNAPADFNVVAIEDAPLATEDGPVASLLDKSLDGAARSEAGEASPTAQMRKVEAALRGVIGALAQLETRGVQRITLEDATLRVMKDEFAVARTLTPLNIEYKRHEDNHSSLVLSLRGLCGIGDLSLTHRNEGATDLLNLELKDVCAADFASALRKPGEDLQTELPLSLNVFASLNENGLERLEGQLLSERGRVEFSPRDQLVFEKLDVPFWVDVNSNAIHIKDGDLQLTRSNLPFHGVVGLPQDDKAAFAFDVQLRPTRLDNIDADASPLFVETGRLAGVFQPQNKLLTVGELSAAGPVFSLFGSGSFGFDQETPSIAAAIDFSNMPVFAAKQLWPPFLAGGARRWILKNAKEGHIRKAEIEVALPPNIIGRMKKGAPVLDDNFTGRVEIDNAVFTTVGEMPPIKNANVVGDLIGKSFTVTANTGHADVPAGRVDLAGTVFQIPDFRFKNAEADLSLKANGDAKAIAEVANREPVRAMDKAKIKTAGLSGEADAVVTAGFRLKRDLKAEEVAWSSELQLSDFSSDAKIDGHTINEADLAVQVDASTFAIQGKGLLDGVAATIDYTGSTDGSGPPSKVAVDVVLNEKDRKKLGIDLEEYLSGPIGVAIRDSGEGQKPRYEVDLTSATLKLGFVGWSKGKGIPAKATMVIDEDDNRTLIKDFKLTGDGFGASGSAEISKGGVLTKLNLSNFQLRKGDNVAVSMALGKGKTYAVKINGKRFDARSLIRSSKKEETGKNASSYRYRVTGNVSQLIGFNGISASNVALDTTIRGSSVLKLSMSGQVGSGNANVSYGQRSGADALSVIAADGGAVLKFVNIYSSMEGGQMVLDGTRPAGGSTMSGYFQVKKFRIVNDVALEEALKNRKDKKTRGASFAKSVVNFTERDGVITMSQGFLKGNEIGGTFKGTINRRTQGLDVTGTYVPLYGLNNVVSKIPLLGLALGNNNREGLLGITFKVAGTLDKPRVQVNPLSAIAPGFLRQIFEFQ